MVRIGIDARFYGTEHKGIGRYTKNVLVPLTRLLKNHELVVFLADPYYLNLKFGNNVRKVRCNLPHYSLTEQSSLPRLITKHQLALWFSFHFNIPIFSRVQKITVIHDLIKTYSKGKDTTTRAPWFYALKRFGYERVISSAVHDSLALIVPTNTVKNDILARYNERPEKIHSIWEAPDPALKSPTRSLLVGSIPNKYLLFVGNAYPHKNLSVLFTALVHLPTHHLVLVTSKTPYLTKLLSALPTKTRIRITVFSQITDAELSYLYRHATALIAPSLMEGFGLPGLEALVVGTPVIASNIPVFREVYGKHATYFDPHSSSTLTDAIKHLGTATPSPFSYPRTWTDVAYDIAEVINESCARL